MLRAFSIQAVIGLLVATAGPALAQGDPDAFAAARMMLQASDFDRQVRATTEQFTDRTITTIMQQFEAANGRPFPPALEAELRLILREHNEAVLAAVGPTALDDAARVYARYFTAAEIRELQRLQSNPVMVKFQRIMPQFSAELSQISMAEAMRRLPELRRRVDEAVRGWVAREARDAEPPAA